MQIRRREGTGIAITDDWTVASRHMVAGGGRGYSQTHPIMHEWGRVQLSTTVFLGIE